MIYRFLLIPTIVSWIATGLLGQTQDDKNSNSFIFQDAVNLFNEGHYNKAFETFEELALKGNEDAQYNLSIFFFKGVGTPTNYEKALYWSWYATLNHNQNAEKKVDELLDLLPQKISEAVANTVIEELKNRVFEGNKEAAHQLSKTYLRLFADPDYRKVYSWALIAQAFGEKEVEKYISEAEKNLEIDTIIEQQNEATELFEMIKK